MIGVVRMGGCNPTAGKTTISGSFSNIKDISGLVGVENAEIRKPYIFPNPVSKTATVKFNNPQNFTFEVFLIDATGRIVHRQSVSTSEFILSPSYLDTGIYTLEIRGHQTYRSLLVVE